MSNPAYQKLKDSHALPSPPAVVLEILRLTGNDNASLGSISEVVESDPALAARTLRLINSPFAGLSRRIGSVSVAVVLLGMRTIKNLALSLSLLAGSQKGRCAAFPYKEFWSESLARAVAARRIAHQLRNFPPDEAFTVGLLAKIGRLGLATGCPTEYARIMASPGANDGAGLLRLEREAFGLDHNELSSEMLVDWRLPELICNAVRFQDAPDGAGADSGSRSAQLARVLHLAGAIASRLVQPDAALERLAALASEAEALGIPGTEFDAFFEGNVSEWHEAGAILSVATGPVPSLTELRARIQEVRQPDEDRSAVADTPGPPAKAPADPLRVLLVDDDPAALRLITEVPRWSGIPGDDGGQRGGGPRDRSNLGSSDCHHRLADAGHRRTRALPPAARGRRGRFRLCHRPVRSIRRSGWSRRWRPARMTSCSSRSAARNCWPTCARASESRASRASWSSAAGRSPGPTPSLRPPTTGSASPRHPTS